MTNLALGMEVLEDTPHIVLKLSQQAFEEICATAMLSDGKIAVMTKELVLATPLHVKAFVGSAIFAAGFYTRHILD